MDVVDLKTVNSSVFARIAHISEIARAVIISRTNYFNRHLTVSLLADFKFCVLKYSRIPDSNIPLQLSPIVFLLSLLCHMIVL